MDDVLLLINQYVDACTSATAQLKARYHEDDVLSAHRCGRIPRNGTLPGALNFEFHGVGCRFQCGSHVVELDFGPGGSVGGFDAWRILSFAESVRHMGVLDVGTLNSALGELEQKGIVIRPGTHPSPHLYYLAKPGEGK